MTPGTRLLAPIAFAVGLLAPAAARAQWGPSQTRFLPVKGWEGTFAVTLSASGSGIVAGFPGTYTITESVSGSIVNAVWDAGIGGWVGTVDGAGTINAEGKVLLGSCTITITQKGTGSINFEKYTGQPTKSFVTLDLGGSDTYSVWFSPSPIELEQVTTTACPDGTTSQTSTVDGSWDPTNRTEGLAFPASGFNLSGQRTMSGPPSFVSTDQLDGYQFTWNLNPTGATEVELVLESADYETWRPAAGDGGTKGTPIGWTAKLQNKDGSPLQAQATSITWELVDTSREPGYAMNAPAAGGSTDYDLRLEESGGLRLEDPQGQKGTTYPPPGATGITSATGTVAPFDWGGWSTLKVTAQLTDGRRVEGHLINDDAMTAIRLPRRFADSFIAQIWLENRHLSGWGDDDDSESDPEGDGHDGDGLTLYEEYRGFIEAGQHIEGDPKKKDFYVRNRGSDALVPGIKTFARLTGLAVHYRLEESEFPASRVMNGNFSAGPHRVNQHGVLIVLNPTIHGFMEAVGGPGNPKMISYIQAPATGIVTGQPGDAGFLEYQNLSLAHELLHACNVWHHGEGVKNVLWTRQPGSETVLENGIPVDLRNESGAPAWSQIPSGTEDPKTGAWTHGYRARLGLPQSVYSGVENCVMRYDDASGYPSAADPNVRYKVTESLAHELCNGRVGTGVNDSAHQPQSRYGDAASGRGLCRSQILVNDAVTAPGR